MQMSIQGHNPLEPGKHIFITAMHCSTSALTVMLPKHTTQILPTAERCHVTANVEEGRVSERRFKAHYKHSHVNALRLVCKAVEPKQAQPLLAPIVSSPPSAPY